MDVVRRHIEKLRGRIEIRSTRGAGRVSAQAATHAGDHRRTGGGRGEERYIVPLFAVREMFRPTAETIWTVQQRAEMALVRGTLLPVFRLYRRFGVKPRSKIPLSLSWWSRKSKGACYCLLVDELIGKQEVVIKSLGETFSGVTGSPAARLWATAGSGLILDLDRLLKDGNVNRLIGCRAGGLARRWAPRISTRSANWLTARSGWTSNRARRNWSRRDCGGSCEGRIPALSGLLPARLTDRTGEAWPRMIDALATNHTAFLREPDHFDFLRENGRCPRLASRDPSRSGAPPAPPERKSGRWPCLLNEALPARRISHPGQRHFEQSARGFAHAPSTRRNAARESRQPGCLAISCAGKGPVKTYSVAPRIAAQVEFRRAQSGRSYSWRRLFPVIFCRNVMIYFDRQTQEQVVGRLAAVL